jgi:hypothetical protein
MKVTVGTDVFEVRRDPYCWILAHERDWVNKKTQEVRRTKRDTYHATLRQACDVILERVAGARCEEVELVVKALEEASSKVSTAIERAKVTLR